MERWELRASDGTVVASWGPADRVKWLAPSEDLPPGDYLAWHLQDGVPVGEPVKMVVAPLTPLELSRGQRPD